MELSHNLHWQLHSDMQTYLYDEFQDFVMHKCGLKRVLEICVLFWLVFQILNPFAVDWFKRKNKYTGSGIECSKNWIPRICIFIQYSAHEFVPPVLIPSVAKSTNVFKNKLWKQILETSFSFSDRVSYVVKN